MPMLDFTGYTGRPASPHSMVASGRHPLTAARWSYLGLAPDFMYVTFSLQ
jgi:hypothetical protein